jgi:hypothetical protein
MEKNGIRQSVAISIIVLMLGAGITQAATHTAPATSINPDTHHPLAITWNVTINATEPGSSSDTVVFGEAPDANDGPPVDVYDICKPPAPPSPPYLRTWFDDSLPTPYDKLWEDYRHYPASSKTWKLYVWWFPSDYATPTTVTLTWNKAKINTTEYTFLNLCNATGVVLRDMRVHNSYTFTCVALIPQLFKIIGHYNAPPNTPNSPSPANATTSASITTDLGWTGGDPDSGDTVTYDVYFGTSTTPPKVSANQSGTSYDPGTMAYNTYYYWRINAWDNHGAKTIGPLWWFKTSPLPNNPPYTPGSPSPADTSSNISVTTTLGWTGGDPDGDPVTYDVYFGTSTTPPKVSSNQSSLIYDPPGNLSYSTTYYWHITAYDNRSGKTYGPLWSFTTHINHAPNTPSSPNPTNGSTDKNIDTDLSWTGGDQDSGDTVTYDVYFSTSTTPPKVSSNQSSTSYDPGTLAYGTTYYWRIIAWDQHHASTQGPIWHFTTHVNHAPTTPNTPTPTDAAINQSINVDLSWLGGDPDSGDTVTYDVYFGLDSTPPMVAEDISTTNYDPGTLQYGTTYYWFINATDNHGYSTVGPLWSFTTEQKADQPPYVPYSPSPANQSHGIPVTTTLSWAGGDPDAGDTVTYDVYLGTTSNPPKVADDLPTANYNPGSLHYNTKYYWKIVTTDNHGKSTNGPIWYFFTVNDTLAPNVKITSPEKGYAYLNLKDIITWKWHSLFAIFFGPIIFGKMTVTAWATDDLSGIRSVAFYIDNDLKFNDTAAPYIWNWTAQGYFRAVALKAVAYDNAGNHRESEVLIVHKS